MNILLEKAKEALSSVLPITIIVLVLNLTIVPLETPLVIRFFIGALLIMMGLTVFLVGVDIGITPIGNLMGSALAKSNKIWIVAMAGIILGFFISIAEPDLHILAEQVDVVTSGVISKLSLVVIVSIGVAVLLAVGLTRIVYNIPLYKTLTSIYIIIFLLGLFTYPEFLAISFDASGATTGALTVPFILALAAGVAALKKDSKASEEDSFGLVGIISSGAILAVMVTSIVSRVENVSGSLEPNVIVPNYILEPFVQILPKIAGEILLALLPLLMLFIIFQPTHFKLPTRAARKILKGLMYTHLGLTLFLVGVNAGFMEVGIIIGHSIASLGNMFLIVFVGFIMGLVTILAEPAVHVLTHQVEDVTSGYIKRPAVLIALSVGVGFALALSMLRIIVPEIQLWHFLLPGYIIAIAMTYVVPELFVGVAFDSGGVASGPMTASFILAFTQGSAEAIEGASVLIEGFGVIAMVALAPLIALQILGLVFKAKSKQE